MPSSLRLTSKILSTNTNATFDMTVRTTSANEAFTIPCHNWGTFNATIDWGDGSSSTVTTYNTNNLSHTYASAGDHAISVSGTFPNIYFNDTGDKTKVISVTNLGQVGWQTFKHAFYGCGNMTSFTSGVADTSNVTDMSIMLASCYNITSIDLSGFNTSSATNMVAMFRSVGQQAPSNFSIDVSSFDTSNVTTMKQMFQGTLKLISLDLSNFDTSNVTDFSYMFTQGPGFASSALDLRHFNTSSATTFTNMFHFQNTPNSSSITSINVTGWDTSNVTGFGSMFGYMENITSIIGLNTFDTSSATAMNGMFISLPSLTSIDVSSFDTTNVTYMNAMFYNNSSITSLDLSSFVTTSLTTMRYMFFGTTSLTGTLDVSSFDTSSVTNMQNCFGNTNLTDINGVENFDIEGINTSVGLSNFMSITLPTSRYDALLVNWDAQDPLDNLAPHFGSSQYTAGGTAAAARANLISTDGWTITDGGTA